MIEIISETKLNDLKCSISYFDFNEFNSIENSYVIKFKEEDIIQRFHYKLIGEKLEKFYFYSSIIFNIFKNITDYLNINDFYIISYFENWYSIKEYSPILFKVFDDKKLPVNYSGAILTDDSNLIKDVFESAQKYNSFPVFISKNKELIVIPTDHLDLFIKTNDFLLYSKLDSILQKSIYTELINIVKK